MRVIPVRAGRVIVADSILMPSFLSRLDAKSRVVHHIVAVDTGETSPGVTCKPCVWRFGTVGVAQLARRFAAGGLGGKRLTTRIRKVSPTLMRNVGAGIWSFMARSFTALPLSIVDRYANCSVTSSSPSTDCSVGRLDEGLAGERYDWRATVAATMHTHRQCEPGAERPSEAQKIST